jgi:hypothetical protein
MKAIILCLTAAALAQQPPPQLPIKLYIGDYMQTKGTALHWPVPLVGVTTTSSSGRNITTKVTALLMRKCPEAVTVTYLPDQANYFLTMDPGNWSILFNQQGDAVFNFKGEVVETVCKYFSLSRRTRVYVVPHTVDTIFGPGSFYGYGESEDLRQELGRNKYCRETVVTTDAPATAAYQITILGSRKLALEDRKGIVTTYHHASDICKAIQTIHQWKLDEGKATGNVSPQEVR